MYSHVFCFLPSTVITILLSIALLPDLFIKNSLASPQKEVGEKKILNKKTMEFIENKGQLTDAAGNLRPDILYIGDEAGAKIYLRKGGLSYVIVKTIRAEENEDQEYEERSAIAEENTVTYLADRIDVTFTGGNTNAAVWAGDPAQGYFNYYLGHCPEGITNVKAYHKIVYEEIYKNIDVEYDGSKQGGLEYNFIVRHGGDPQDIRLKYSGAEKIELIKNRLIITTSIGKIRELIPDIYQKSNGKKVTVAGSYELQGEEVSIKIGRYDKNQALIIDPWVTYFGGSDNETSRGIATDVSGNVLVTGGTSSVNFPVSPGAYQTTFKGSADIFIGKFSSGGSRIWCTYFGGGGDEAYDITADANSDILITGKTYSGDFPITTGAAQTILNGPGDAFVSKFSAGGTLLWSTYYGGTTGGGDEIGWGIAANAANDVIIVGQTPCTDFPVTAGAFQSTYGGVSDAFLAKFSSGTGAVLLATYCGGNGRESTTGASVDIAVDGAGNIVITGSTESSTGLPITAGGFQSYLAGSTDAFIIQFDASGNPAWGTYYGGSGWDGGSDVAVDASNNIIITGTTSSVYGDFPFTPGAFQTKHGSSIPTLDAFIAKFTPTGNRLWSTFLGEYENDEGLGVAVDKNDDIFVGGDTYNTNFPVTSCAFQKIHGGGPSQQEYEDNYIAHFDPDGNLVCATYVGGGGHDELTGGLAVYDGFVCITGLTPGFYPVTAGSFQPNYGGLWSDAFIAVLCSSTCGNVNSGNNDFSADQTTICMGSTINYSATNTGCDTANTTFAWSFPGGTPATSTTKNPSAVLYNTQGTYDVKLVMTTPCGKDSVIKYNYIKIQAPIADAGPDVTILKGASTILNGTGGVSFTWDPAIGLSCTNCQNPTADPPTTAKYYLEVIDASGCTSTDSVNVFVFSGDILYVPNSFTPNDDGKNDIFLAYGTLIGQFEMRIFNRWGQLIFLSDDITKGWDGKYKNSFAQEDVYVYQLNFVIGSSPQKITGRVVLIR